MPAAETAASRSGAQPTAPRRPILHSLRTKLVLFSAALVAVPGAVFAVLAFSSARSAIEKVVGEQLVEVARDAADGLTTALRGERSQVRTWARSELMRDLVVGDVDKRIARYLASLREGHPEYLAIVAIDAEGRTAAATDRGWMERSWAGEPWWPGVRDGAEALVGPHRMPGAASPVLELVAPVHHPEDPTRRLGALLLVYDWHRTEEILAKIRENLAAVGSRLDLLVVDARSAVIGGSWSSAALDGIAERTLRDLEWRSADAVAGAGRESIVEEPTISALVACEPLDQLSEGWRVVAVWPLRDALAPIRRMQRSWSLVLASVFAAGIGVATILANRMVDPLRALTDATRELALHGETKHPVPIATRDEIGELGHAFNSMIAELNRARDDLVTAAKFSFAGQVAAGIAHEVRTPLGVLRTSAQMLARSLGTDASRRELVDMIVAEVDRLEGVVAELLELSRPREAAIEEAALDPLLKRAADFLAPTAREKGVRLELEPTAAPRIFARCDPDQIYQVVLNLTMNAIQALGAGGTVRLRSLLEDDGRVGFEVEDDGPGIQPEDRERLFTPFFTKRSGGTGLGLAIVERIVQGHRGKIEVESSPGRGARFRIRLPAANPGAAP